jgi:hypothetical protein
MLFDGFDIYIAGTVLGAKLKSGLHFQKGVWFSFARRWHPG